MASSDAAAAAAQLGGRWERELPADLAALTWDAIGKQSALKLEPEASDYFMRAAKPETKTATDLARPEETMAWKARAALRADNGRPRWQQVVQAIAAMRPAEQL